MASTQPIAHRITVDEFERMALDGHWELIDGELVEMAVAGRRASRVGLRIGRLLLDHVDAHGLGEVYGADAGFVLFPDRSIVRSPDAAFVRADRLPSAEEEVRFLRLAPDLAVEVLSPSDSRTAALSKVAMYLEAGVSLVWLVDPDARTIAVFAPDAPIALLREGDTLTGGDILPDLTASVSNLLA